MNSFRNKFCFLGAIILLLCILVFVWYVLFYSQKPGSGISSTLVLNEQSVVVVGGQDKNPVQTAERSVMS